MNKSYLAKYNNYLIALLTAVGFLLLPGMSHALEIKDAPVEIRNDFVLEPAKMEVNLKPGEKTVKTLSVVNRTDRTQQFTVNVEDFEGSKDPNQVVVLLGNDRGPYSLKDYIKPEVNSFTLKPKQRVSMSVTITIPQDAEPGGRYGSVLVSSEPVNSAIAPDENRARTISRLGALYFVRIAGKVKEDADLKDFRLTGAHKAFYEKGPFNFELLFENNSSVHLTPGGRVEIKNMLGRVVKQLDVTPFFSLPASLRAAQVSWDSSLAFGRYTATAYIDRGYKDSPDVTDTKTIVFWILPWKVIVGLIIVILLIAFVLRAIMRSFEIRRKK